MLTPDTHAPCADPRCPCPDGESCSFAPPQMTEIPVALVVAFRDLVAKAQKVVGQPFAHIRSEDLIALRESLAAVEEARR